jgi:hypothetical protein
LIDGTCETCPVYFHPDIENKNCVQCDRQDGEYIKTDGTCKECEGRTVVADGFKSCKPVDCEDGEIMTEGSNVNGMEETWCDVCDDYKIPNDEADECVEVVCPADSKKNKDGTCTSCPPYYTPLMPD